MKFNKQIAIVLTLVSLLLSALGGAYYFYIQNKKAIKSSNQLIVVYVASKNIKNNAKIEAKDLKQFKTAKKFVLNKPLLKKDIIGQYAKENIYKNDTFTKERLSKTLVTKETKKGVIDSFKFNSYNISFKMFRNPNFSLKQGDIINIISVYPSSIPKANGSSNAVQYVAKNIKVLGFLINGEESNNIKKKVKKTRTVKKKKITEEVMVKADEMILDINNKLLLSLTDDYNRGSQLWMVKTKPIKKAKVMVSRTTKQIKSKRTYPTTLYKAKDGYDKFKATIHYADQKNAALTKNKTIKINTQEVCKNSDLFILGISNKVHLRTGSTNQHKIIRTVYRNYIIPYSKKVNPNWYKTCDGYYVHKLEVKEITKELVDKKLKK